MKKHIITIFLAVTTVTANAVTLSLPFADSFAGGKTLDADKWERQEVSGNPENVWLMGSKISSFRSGDPEYQPYDYDGGLIYCHFYSSREGNDARLATQPIAVGNAPVVDFYLWRAGIGDDAIKVQVQTDGGEWQDVAGGTFLNKPEAGSDDAAMGWHHYTLGLGKQIPAGATSFRVGFLSVSQWGYNMAIDAVNIYDIVGNDLEAVDLTAPSKVVAGNDIELQLTVANKGNAVSAADYTIEITSDYPMPIEVESVDIPSAATVKLDIPVALTAEEAYGLPKYHFSARIDFADDGNPENNDTGTVAVSTAFSRNESPKNVRAIYEQPEAGSISILWDEAKDGEYVPVNLSENFESLPEGTTGNFNGWISLDLDGRGDEYGYYTAFSSEWEVVVAGAPTEAHGDNHFLAVTIDKGAQQDDWLISPRIDCKEGSSLTLEARVACRSSETSTVHMQVLYSEEEDYNPASPARSFEVFTEMRSGLTEESVLYQDDAFHKMWIRDIPSSAKYIAIRFDTSGTTIPMAMWLDDLKIYEEDTAQLFGYHVYERNKGRLNAETLSPVTLEYSFVDGETAADERTFYVTAVYEDGESEPAEVSAATTVVSGIAVADARVEVFTLDGRRVAAGTAKDNIMKSLERGLYIVKTGNNTQKILVK